MNDWGDSFSPLINNRPTRSRPLTLVGRPLVKMEAADNVSIAMTHHGNETNMEEEEDRLGILSENMDHLFLMIMGTMILFMQAGFAFLEAGSVRAKNTINILIKNFSDLAFGE